MDLAALPHLPVRGVHPKVGQELLGHRTITLTIDSHVQPALHAEVVPGYMEALFGGGSQDGSQAGGEGT